MTEHWLSRMARRAARVAGRRVAETTAAYRSGRTESIADVALSEDGTGNIVCRRYAERRTVGFDAEARPLCFEAGHPDCEGCAEDVRDGRIETW